MDGDEQWMAERHCPPVASNRPDVDGNSLVTVQAQITPKNHHHSYFDKKLYLKMCPDKRVGNRAGAGKRTCC